ncbi:MAG: CdaR family protein [Patescibacteria group bacterium]|nr:hypothetical protein [Patescibacteria group bacterium]
MKWILGNLKLKILALISAIVFWVFIIGIQNTFYKFPEQIPVQAFNLASGLSVVEDLGKVGLILNVDENLARTLSVKDFTAYMDFQAMGEGESIADILVTSKNPNAQVLNIYPDQLEVTIEKLETKSVPIVYKLKGEPREGYEVGTIRLSKNYLQIEGAKTVLENAIEAIAEFSMDGKEIGEVTKNGALKIVDIDGDEITNLQMDNGGIEATISIEQISEKKAVGIEPVFIGQLSEGWIKKISVSPQTVSIKGDPVTLEKIDTIETEKIDLRTISGTSTIKVKLRLPDKVKVEDEINEVSVTLEVETK